jgi:hypothetical protein
MQTARDSRKRHKKNSRLSHEAPQYVVVETTGEPEVLTGYYEAERVVNAVASLWGNPIIDALGLKTAKHIVLLDRCNWDTYSMLARGREIELAMYEFWRCKEIPARVIEIM